jgi:hypothetical protein
MKGLRVRHDFDRKVEITEMCINLVISARPRPLYATESGQNTRNGQKKAAGMSRRPLAANLA